MSPDGIDSDATPGAVPAAIRPADMFRPGPNRTAVEYLFKAIFLNDKRHLADLMAAYIAPGTCVVDVGSSVGYYARRFADKNPGGMVLAFEPQSLPRAIFTVASLFRRRRDIVVLPFALGGSTGMLDLKIPIKKKGQIGISLAHTGDADDLHERFSVKHELSPCETLDNVLDRIDAGRVSLIKIDVEGGEQEVLRGASQTLARHRPVVVCETDRAMGRFGDTVAGLRTFMAGLDYHAICLRTGRELAPEDEAHDTVFLPVATPDA